jgi:hypothetical protein
MDVLRGALLVPLFALSAAHAASNVSAKYDGSYEGAATPALPMRTAGCPAFTLNGIAISNGFLKTPQGEAAYAVSGFITEEGYVSAFLARAGHVRSALDGRMEDGVISAGFIESDSGCAWIVHLRRRS